MSRIGKKPVPVPSGVKVSVDTNACAVAIEGAKGKLSMTHRPEVVVQWNEDDKSISCHLADGVQPNGQGKAYWGLTRSLVNNMIEGVTMGYTKRLQIVGAGYNAKQKGQDLVLKLGYANELVYRIPAGIEIGIERDIVSVSGIDKQLVGEFAAKIRLAQNPEPYNGKGVRYFGEHIIKKQGKAFGA
jgi:large subunit ribosomal protein L6